MQRTTLVRHAFWGTLLVSACSLQMPSEAELFGGMSGTGGGGAGASALGGSATAGAAGVAATLGGSSGRGAGASGRGGETSAGASGRGGETSGRGGDASAGTASGRAGAGGTSQAGAGGGSGAEGGHDSGSAGLGEGGGEPSGDGLMAHFPFDEESGTSAANVVDSSKRANCAGACSWPPGRHGGAVSIRNQSGTSDWIELPVGLLRGLSAASVSIWVRVMSTTRQGARLFQFSAAQDEEISFTPDDVDEDESLAGSHLEGSHRGAKFVDLWNTTPNLTDKEWHHVVMTWSSQSIDFYVDGSQRAQRGNPPALPSDLGATGPDYLGRSRDEDEIALYAELDDLRIYARALTASEVGELYRAP